MKLKNSDAETNGRVKRQRCEKTGEEISISHRSFTRALSPYNDYFQSIGNGKHNKWTPDNPDGMLVLALAENNLTQQPLLDRLQKALQEVKLTPEALMYADWEGMPRMRDAVAGLANRTFMKGVDIEAKHLVVSGGAGSVVENLFYALCDEGDGVLIPAPYYPAFDNDLEVKISTKAVPVQLDVSGDIETQLDAAFTEAHDKGTPIKVLLLTNPNNPLGTIYLSSALLTMLRWCLHKGVHCVSDEIYALSVWGEDAVFESMESVAKNLTEEEKQLTTHQLHTIFGLSKDFGASGIRIGVLHTRNPLVLAVMSNVAYFGGSSNLAQVLMTEVLNDVEWVDSFVEENNKRMRESYKGLEGVLKSGGIAHTAANSAMFCWLDLRPLLRESTWEAEWDLWHELVNDKKIIFTPGRFCHAPSPGFFRCCWAWTPPEGLLLAGSRLVELKNMKLSQETQA